MRVISTSPLTRAEIASRSATGAIVSFAALAAQYGIAFGSQIVLARLLQPEYFGVLALVTIYAMFFNNIVNTQGDKYLVQEREDIESKLDNIFTLELALAVIVSAIVILLAPPVLRLVGKESLIRPVQFLVIAYFANPFSKPRALYEREISILQARWPGVFGQVVGSALGICLAYFGYGIWSLLWWRVSTLLVEAAAVWLTSPYKPRLAWNASILRGILAFSWPLIISSVLVFFYWNIDYYIVGQVLGTRELGYYWLAYQVSHYFLRIKTAMNSVLFPAFARLEAKDDRVRAFNFFTGATSALYTVPAVLVIAFGTKLIPLVFGDQWLPATLPFQIFFIVVILRSIAGNTGPLLYAFGQTRQDFYVAIVNAVLVPLCVYPLTLLYGIAGAAIGVCTAGMIAAFMVFQVYIRPLSGLTFFHYHARPLAAVGLAFLISAYLHQSQGGRMALVSNSIALLILAGAYYALFRTILLQAVRRVLSLRLRMYA